MKNGTTLFIFATLGSLFVAYRITADNKEVEPAKIPLWKYSNSDIGLQEKEPSMARRNTASDTLRSAGGSKASQ